MAKRNYRAYNPVVMSILNSELVNDNEFLYDIKVKLNRFGSLSEKQGAAVIVAAIKNFWYRQRIEQSRLEEASAPDVVVGNGIQITGEVLSVKWRDTQFGMVLKMTVQDDRGFKVWGSVPKSLGELPVGAHVTFVANVVQADDNPKFGFFKRPRQARALAVA